MSRHASNLLGVALLVLAAPPLDGQMYPVHYPPAAEGPYLDPTTGHSCFRLADVLGYLESAQIATIMGGTVAPIQDAAKQQWLLDRFGEHAEDTAIGLVRSGATWQWASGDPVTFTDWAPGEPSASATHAAGIANWRGTPSVGASRAIIECPGTIGPVIPGFTCTPADPDFQLVWAPSGYDTIRIYVNMTLIATVPASDLGWVDAGVGTGWTRDYLLIGQNAAGQSLPARCTGVIPDGDGTIRIPDVVGGHPGPREVPVVIDHPMHVAYGLSMGICFDTSVLEVVDLSPGAAVLVLGDPEYIATKADDDGFALSIYPCLIYDHCSILPGANHEIAVVTLTAIGPAPISEPLRICRVVGMPPVDVLLDARGGGIAAVGIDGSLTLDVPGFIRGDANHDGALDIADVVFLGDLLFGPAGPDFPCREACEANGDAQVDIADMVTLLGHLFLGGPPPGAPFPGCGIDPEPASGWGCVEGGPCP